MARSLACLRCFCCVLSVVTILSLSADTDSASLVQQSLGKSPWLDVYVTTADTIEDIMYWAVLYKSMKPLYHAHPHWLLIRREGELMKRAHAIRMAIGGNYWHARLDIFNPQQLNLEAVEANSWRQLAPLQYTADEYRRVVHMNADMLVFKNIDDMTHRVPHMILAREMGDCRNLTEALNSEQPATALYSMVPDTGITTWLTSTGSGVSTRLFEESLEAGSESLTRNASRSFKHAIMLSRAFSRLHPERQQSRFGANEVLSANCFMHHKDQVLRAKNMLDVKALYFGEEGRKLINEIIIHGETRLVNTLTGLVNAGKATLANALRVWFEAFSSDEVKAVIEAAKNGPLAES
eukprot:CAMPEP_0171085590 /NCGR_PEP_ID=MMETSP0766_2-20121228/19028_1 /TAXON_ID=439317 /ORGANISM="Gambierdiscus australes, Strain CAWD 149" /LENGTH=350 /DNA_ID=CAMNT_0011543173 /DNA_START=73 /DNA_END=1125 /DNA_ORIENTATION=-